MILLSKCSFPVHLDSMVIKYNNQIMKGHDVNGKERKKTSMSSGNKIGGKEERSSYQTMMKTTKKWRRQMLLALMKNPGGGECLYGIDENCGGR